MVVAHYGFLMLSRRMKRTNRPSQLIDDTGPIHLGCQPPVAFDKDKARDRSHEPTYPHLTANSRARYRSRATAEHVGDEESDIRNSQLSIRRHIRLGKAVRCRPAAKDMVDEERDIHDRDLVLFIEINIPSDAVAALGPLSDLGGDQAACDGEAAACDQGAVEHGQGIDPVIHSRAKRRPGGTVRSGNVIGTGPACRGEIAACDQSAVEHGQGVDGIIHSRPERRESVPRGQHPRFRSPSRSDTTATPVLLVGSTRGHILAAYTKKARSSLPCATTYWSTFMSCSTLCWSSSRR